MEPGAYNSSIRVDCTLLSTLYHVFVFILSSYPTSNPILVLFSLPTLLIYLTFHLIHINHRYGTRVPPLYSSSFCVMAKVTTLFVYAIRFDLQFMSEGDVLR